MRNSTVRAGDLEIVVKSLGTQGQGAILLHGFPDDPGSWRGLARALVAAEYQVHAPYMPGYGRSTLPRDGHIGVERLGRFVIELADALELRRPVLVGHDWGAIATYAACTLAPERFERAVAMSVPPVTTLVENLRRHPDQLRRSAYMGLFQLGALADRWLRRDDFAYVDQLWSRWSPDFSPQPRRLEAVKRSLRTGDGGRSALRYYRSLLVDGLRDPARWRRSWELVRRRIRVPTLLLTGERDGCIAPELFEGAESCFDDLRLEIVAGAGHFVHLEHPHYVHERVVEFVGQARR